MLYRPTAFGPRAGIAWPWPDGAREPRGAAIRAACGVPHVDPAGIRRADEPTPLDRDTINPANRDGYS